MMMRSVFSDQLSDFSALYDDVELVSVQRPGAAAKPLATAAAEWLAPGGTIETQWVQSRERPQGADDRLTSIRDGALRSALREEIDEAVALLTDLLDCSNVGVRVATLDGPMCPKFHTDMVPCRLLITLEGPGTEWIAHDEVDFERFADRTVEQPAVRAGRFAPCPPVPGRC